MAKFSHLNLDDRYKIQNLLDDKFSISDIARQLGRDRSTIYKEILRNRHTVQSGCKSHNYNNCIHRFTCSRSHICRDCVSERKYSLCRRCRLCNAFCKDFVRFECLRLSKPPYVCNACGQKAFCFVEKKYYKASVADDRYRSVLSDSRKGISFSEEEIASLDSLVSPLIRQGQSPHHVCSALSDIIPVSERTIYRLIDSRAISAMNIDLPRKVRFKPRRIFVHKKVDTKCRIGRTYEDFLSFLSDNPGVPVTQLDSVEGVKGGKVLLTIHFSEAELMLAFLRDSNTSRSVSRIFSSLYELLGHDLFSSIFRVCLSDNGTEFSNPKAIELSPDGSMRTRLFYCDPSSPFQKGSAERNHEFIRCFIPKGRSLDHFSQDDINTMMDHINSYRRDSLGNRSPYEMFEFMYGRHLLDLLECHLIPPQDVTLNKSVFRRVGNLS